MITNKLLQKARTLCRLPKGLVTLHSRDEDAALEATALRAYLVKAETAGKLSAGEPEALPEKNEEKGFLGKDAVRPQEDEEEEEELLEAQAKRETQELLLLQELLPFFLQNNLLQEAEGAVMCFIDRNPMNADGFVLLADVYIQGNNLPAAAECLWGAIHNCPGNRVLVRFLHSVEEQFLLKRCQLPLPFMIKSLESPNQTEYTSPRFQDVLESIFRAEESPVVVLRQGNNVSAFATRDLQPGDMIFRQRPFVLTPMITESAHIYSNCFHCLQERENPDRAFSCPVSPHSCPFVFCSWECLMRNSRIHALECQALPLLLAAAKEAQLSAMMVLHIVRTLVKTALDRQGRQNAESAKDVGDPAADVVQQLLTLNSYRAAVEEGQPEVYEQLTLLARRLQRVLPAHLLLFMQERDLIELMLVVWQYSPVLTCPSVPSAVERRNPDGAIGQVLAPAVSLLRHSCVPTCGLCLQDDGFVAVRALTFIPSGGTLCVSLEEDLFKSQRDRKDIKALPRVFGCGCVRCTDTAEGGRLLRGIRCSRCIRGFLCPHKSRSLECRLKSYSAAVSILNDEEAGKALSRGAPEVDALPRKKRGSTHRRASRLRARGNREKKLSQDMSFQGELGSDEEAWLCRCCGLASAAVSRRCAQVDVQAMEQQAKAEKALVCGNRLQARRLYTRLVEEFSTQLHPQHAVLFNAHTVLAGLLASHPAQDPTQGLVYIRRASLAAETVLPPSCRLKMDLYLKLAELTFQVMQLNRHCRRGPPLPPEFIMGPMHVALWNCCVCFGNCSSLTIVLQQRFRRVAAFLGVCTPPLLSRPKLKAVIIFADLYRQTTGNKAASDEEIASRFSEDPMFLAVAFVRRGVCVPLALELFTALKDIPHLPTGHTLLGLACLYRQVQVVRELLAAGFNPLYGTALGVSALLGMCATAHPRSMKTPGAPGTSGAPGPSPLTGQEVTQERKLLEDSIKREAVILGLLLQRCDMLDAALQQQQQSISKASALESFGDRAHELKTAAAVSGGGKGAEHRSPAAAATGSSLQKEEEFLGVIYRKKLLNACTHRLLGNSFALHLAASRGKSQLCRQLVAAGCQVDVLNLEGATPLHLACISGDTETVGVLLDFGAAVNASTLRGETPLVLAAYHLHREICLLLLGRGADPSIITRAEGFSVLHAVAAGVTRQICMKFRALSYEGDGTAAALAGLNESSLQLNTYTKANSYISNETFVDLRLPSAAPESPEIFLFPGVMLERTRKAHEVLLVLIHQCPTALFTLRSRKGFSPAELLLSTWDGFMIKRERMLGLGDLQVEGQTRDEKMNNDGGWDFVLQQIFRIRDMLSLRSPIFIPKPGRSELIDSPRPGEIAKRDEQRLVAEAPWLFPDIIRRTVLSLGGSIQQKTLREGNNGPGQPDAAVRLKKQNEIKSSGIQGTGKESAQTPAGAGAQALVNKAPPPPPLAGKSPPPVSQPQASTPPKGVLPPAAAEGEIPLAGATPAVQESDAGSLPAKTAPPPSGGPVTSKAKSPPPKSPGPGKAPPPAVPKAVVPNAKKPPPPAPPKKV